MNTDDLKSELQNAVGGEEPLFLSPSQLGKVSTDDIPEAVMVSVGSLKDGIMHIEWDGHFFKEAGALKAYCQYIWTRKYWEAPLGMPFYLDLVKRSVEVREKSQKDVRLLTWDDDGAFIQLSFECNGLPEKLSDAYAEIKQRISWLEEGAEDVSLRVGILAAEAAQVASGWGKSSLEQLVTIVETAENNNDKGRSLEELMSRLFASVPGFTVSGRVRTQTEEIDISIVNGSEDPRLAREDALILAECKNWSSKCGKNEFVIFREKLENRRTHCSLGFLVSWNGFSETITKEMLRGSRERAMIVPLDGQQIRNAVKSESFDDCILKAWEETTNI